MSNEDSGDNSASPVERINAENRMHGVQDTENAIMCEIRR